MSTVFPLKWTPQKGIGQSFRHTSLADGKRFRPISDGRNGFRGIRGDALTVARRVPGKEVLVDASTIRSNCHCQNLRIWPALGSGAFCQRGTLVKFSRPERISCPISISLPIGLCAVDLTEPNRQTRQFFEGSRRLGTPVAYRSPVFRGTVIPSPDQFASTAKRVAKVGRRTGDSCPAGRHEANDRFR